MRHEAGTSQRRRARIGESIDVGAQPDQTLHHRKLSGNACTPQRSDTVNGPVLRHLVETLLLTVGIADRDEILGDLDVSAAACNEQRRAAVSGPFDHLLADVTR